MSRALEIKEAIAALVLRQGRPTFSREDVRGQLGVDPVAWSSAYDAVFHGMRADQPPAAEVPVELRGLFRLVERGKYALTEAGRRLLSPPPEPSAAEPTAAEPVAAGPAAGGTAEDVPSAPEPLAAEPRPAVAESVSEPGWAEAAPPVPEAGPAPPPLGKPLPAQARPEANANGFEAEPRGGRTRRSAPTPEPLAAQQAPRAALDPSAARPDPAQEVHTPMPVPASESREPSPAPPAFHPAARPRRLRRAPALRRMVRETSLSAEHLIAPLFVADGRDVLQPISSMPGHAQRSVDHLDPAVDEVAELGIPAVLLFGIPAYKDARGSGAWDPAGPVPSAIRAIKARWPHLVVIADVCLCEYTDHGHCGVLSPDGEVLNDPTLELLGRAAVAYADAGADIVAPSAMMDGQVGAIRAALDAAGHLNVAILAYAAKFASCFYGPFREAAESTPAFGDRRAYQMDPPNFREALREVALDAAEGADLLMVKPALPYLDVIREVRQRFDLPLVAYQVSGEYAMLKAAAANGWIDERRAALETLYAIRRAGADLVISYYATQAVRWLREEFVSAVVHRSADAGLRP